MASKNAGLDRKRLLISAEGLSFFPRNGELHAKDGFISKEVIKKAKPGDVLTTNLSGKYIFLIPRFVDLMRRLRREPQIVLPKDIGAILAATGINSSSRVVDAGAGSGALSCFLANIVKEVVTYELREDFIAVVKENIEWLGLKNIKVKQGDIRKPIPEKGRDLMTLDIPEPWDALNTASSCLKVGGFLVSYVPGVPQMSQFVDAARKRGDFMVLKSIELIEREWLVDGMRVRPSTHGISHTGFLTFCRKIKASA